MIKPIVLYGNLSLRKPTLPYKKGINVSELIRDLWNTMYNADGAGLAGPQIGLPARIFVIDLPDQEWKGIFINPLILSYNGEDTIMEEGCLSLPGLTAPVVRKDKISIEYYDENWKYHQETYQGIRSRVIQHEYDHLEGVLWIDRVDPTIGVKLIESLRMITNREIEVPYPTI